MLKCRHYILLKMVVDKELIISKIPLWMEKRLEVNENLSSAFFHCLSDFITFLNGNFHHKDIKKITQILSDWFIDHGYEIDATFNHFFWVDDELKEPEYAHALFVVNGIAVKRRIV